MRVNLGVASIECPHCGQVIPMPVRGTLVTDEDGGSDVRWEPDMTELRLHVWTHQEGANA